MKKIHINDFIKEYKDKFSVLVDEYGYQINEIIEQSVKAENHKIHKIQYINSSAKRLIEVVLISQDYKTHMFSRYCDTYFKRIGPSASIPDYTDTDNCFNLFEISELTPTFNTHTEIDLILKSIEQIIIENQWPTNMNLSELRTKRVGYETKVGYKNHPYISEIKSVLNDLIAIGFDIIFDENNLAPYEQSFMGPKLTYKHITTRTIYRICFQSRDQEFSVSRNNKPYWYYGIATKEKYEDLKDKIITDVKSK